MTEVERETKWTLEPWEATEFEVRAGRKTVADCLLGSSQRQPEMTVGEIKANIRLIAAAPQMYEALAMVRRWSEMYKRGLPGYERGLVEAALTAADGGTK